MKKVVSIALILAVSATAAQGQFLKKIGNKVKDNIGDQAADRTNRHINNEIDKADHPGNKADQSTSNNANNTSNASNGSNQSAANGVSSLKTYQNYDFVPGDKILFADDFADDQDGEFPSHWSLEAGQGVINKIGGMPAMTLTEGNYARIAPLIKNKSYLTDPFTIECDYFPVNGGAYGVNFFLKNSSSNYGIIHYDQHGNVSSSYFAKNYSADYPDKAATDASYYNKWHHIAIIYKNKQIKCYLDQNRVLVMPGVDIVPTYLEVGGIGGQNPIVFTNFRIASGGNMNTVGKKFTDAKIVTHGITFDVDKATIKPESMGTLNMVANVMKENPDIKFEIDGHTDNSGASAHNLTLSQQRAEAVKNQLAAMGIDGARLTTKGLGDSKPIDNNATPEGKANNRRVEFVKI